MSDNDFRREYQRPYQFAADLRLIAVHRTADATMFIGVNMADDAVAYLEKDGMLVRLDQTDLIRTQLDTLVTGPIDVDYPYRVWVVNPDDELGKASNAMEFDKSGQAPVLDVLVDGSSVVDAQVARIDLTRKLDVVAKPDSLYGTDSDGRETMYPLADVKGVQRVTLNGEELPVTGNTVTLDDIARASQTVTRTDAANVVYATGKDGNQTVIDLSHFATSSDMSGALGGISSLTDALARKQDKDEDAVAGDLAVFDDKGNSVDAGRTLGDIDRAIAAVANSVTAVSTTLGNETTERKQADSDIRDELEALDDKLANATGKDWKAMPGPTAIDNHPCPVSGTSLVVTNLAMEDEAGPRGTLGAVVLALDAVDAGEHSVSVGDHVASADYAASVGAGATAARFASAFGQDAVADGPNAVALGSGSRAPAESSVAVGAGSKAQGQYVVSVGDPEAKPNPLLRRLTALADPVDDTDAVPLSYLRRFVSDRLDAIESKVDELMNSGAAKTNTTINDLLDKVWGDQTVGDDGHIDWGQGAGMMIPMADLNVFCADVDEPTEATTASSLRSRPISDGDFRVR